MELGYGSKVRTFSTGRKGTCIGSPFWGPTSTAGKFIRVQWSDGSLSTVPVAWLVHV